jgi:hypothetical protein
MPTISDITTTRLSTLNYIDALLDKGPDWNFLTSASGMPVNTLTYTFSVTSGNEDPQSASANFTGSAQAFSAAQQAQARAAFAYLSEITGIQFVYTDVGTDAQIHLANVNLINSGVTGLCSWQSSYLYSGTQVSSYDADAYVYLDNVEWGAENANLTPGTQGYETLLHELGHALGLKHPFVDGPEPNQIVLPTSQNSTYNTLMSYKHVGGPYAEYRQDDLAALAWLYGGDGLRGALGINSTTGAVYLMGSSGDDTLPGTAGDDIFEGDGGNDMINGGGGNDTAVFRAVRSNYNISVLANGDLQVASKDSGAGSDGTDTLHAINTLQFADMSVTRQAVVAANTAPITPSLSVIENASGYATSVTPTVNGSAEAGDTIKIYTLDNVLVGTAKADANGAFTAILNPFNDGTAFHIYAIASNSAGVSSAASPIVSFNIDGHIPILAVTKNANGYATGSTPVVTGSAKAGDTVSIYTSNDVLVGTVKVDSTGLFRVVLDTFKDGSNYQIHATATDSLGVTSTSSQQVSFNVDAHAPTAPTANLSFDASGNTMTFKGTGEVGTTIDLIHAGATIADSFLIAETKVNADGFWSLTSSPLPNGDYNVKVVSSDLAGNSTSAGKPYPVTVNNADNLTGTANNDTLHTGAANIAIDGGAGTDTLVVNGGRANYTLAKEVWGFGLTDNVGSGGHDTLLNVERVQFNDDWVALDVNGNAGEIFRLYQAAFGRPAEKAGLGYWIWRMDNGASLTDVSHEFMTGQPEFDQLYGTNPSDTDFINHLYENVLHREADSGGFTYWLNVLHNSPNARADVLTGFSESPENQALVIGTIQNGMTFTPWHTT